jgi:hypothetical protein
VRGCGSALKSPPPHRTQASQKARNHHRLIEACHFIGPTASPGREVEVGCFFLLFFCGVMWMQIRCVGAPSMPPGHFRAPRKAGLPHRQLNNLSSQMQLSSASYTGDMLLKMVVAGVLLGVSGAADPLSCFVKAPATANNICRGTYANWKYPKLNATECGAQCLSDKDCDQFIVSATGQKGQVSCRISHTFPAPTSYEATWAGYSRKNPSDCQGGSPIPPQAPSPGPSPRCHLHLDLQHELLSIRICLPMG